MGRRESPARTKPRAKRPAKKKPRTNESSRLRALEKSLSEALEQQAAAAEILRVISRSPADVQPVLDTIAQSAARLCGGEFCHVFRFDGKLLHFAAHHGLTSDAFEIGRRLYPMPPGRGTAAARSIVSGSVEEIPDVKADRDYAHNPFAKAVNYRSIVAVPMLHDGVPIGAIAVARARKGRFPRRQIELFKTFADQAVIAIQNVRLFTQAETRNRDLAEALEQQTATSEILRVISRSPTDVQPVFDTIADAALNLCRASSAAVFTFDGEFIHLAAIASLDPKEAEAMRRVFPRLPSRDTAATRAILTRHPVIIPDVLEDPEFKIGPTAVATGFRSILSIPLLRDGNPIGVIGVGRSDPGPFADTQIELLKTFADQALIAIENVRLFTELAVRNRDLTEALEQQTATSEILRVISRSPTDVQPVFDTIANAALKLCSATRVVVTRFDGELLSLAALANVSAEGAEAVRNRYPRPPGRSNAQSRAVLTRSIVSIPDVLEDPEYEISPAMVASGFRSITAVPLLREGSPIGAIGVTRPVPGAFPEKQVALLQTFADQAVIAIENVRLFRELEVRNRDLTEALEHQTATSEILRVISSSPTDVHPVFEVIGERAEKLCDAQISVVSRVEDGEIHLAALHGVAGEGREAIKRYFPMPVSAETVTARAVRARDVVHVADYLADPALVKDAAIAGGYRACLAVPMAREGHIIGVIFVARTRAGRFADSKVALLRTFADQAVIAIENVRLFKELEVRNRDLTEALEQQTATAEILQVISSSHVDLQPVFDTIVRNAARLCDGMFATVLRFDGERLHCVATSNSEPAFMKLLQDQYPMLPDPSLISGRAILGKSVVATEDALSEPDFVRSFAIAGRWRRMLCVPMMHAGEALGVIQVGWAEPGPVPKGHEELLKTFADQAVIAIENVRLFKELEVRNRDLTEALEQQTATSEILRVISRSPTEVQPVFDSIAKAAQELCRATSVNVFTYDGELVRVAAMVNLNPAYVATIHQIYPRPPGRDTAVLRAIQDRCVTMIPDVLDDRDYSNALGVHATAGGFRSVLAVPLMREGQAIGGIAVGRAESGVFPEAQVALLKTFADQAVIAIENVRLFKELEARNRDLTESLEHQTATSEILRVISSSPTDAQPVFDIISRRAAKLCEAQFGVVTRVDSDLIHLAAFHGVTQEAIEVIRQPFPMRLDAKTATARAVQTRSTVHITDVLADPLYETKHAATAGGWRNALAVPMIREGQVIGAIFVGRASPGRFADSKIELLKTFADQAVIAIENVRLFNELNTRTAQLTSSVAELKALGEVGQAVSSTLDLGTVLRTIVSRAVQLAGMDGGSIWEYDEAREEFHLHATDRLPADLVEALGATPIRKGEGALGRMAVTGEPVEIRDVADERTYQSRVREVILRCGYHGVLSLPLLRENNLLGALAVNQKKPGAFDPQVIDLLKTFAAQSALAIQNARLFREIEEKGRQLEIASRHKSEFLANMSHELRTPLNAIIGFSEVLAERMFGEVNEKQAEYLSDILESGRHLLGLINDILDLSKIEAGRMELERSDFDLPGAIENTLILVRERAQRRGIRLERSVERGVGTIHADERKVKQVLLNLLSNALKFTPEGGRIDLRARIEDSVAEISVADTGVGIAPEDQQAVFEEFRQVGTASKKVEGTGLGLAISRKFIELHGGRIWVESKVGAGSKFTFTLPLTGIDKRAKA